MLTPNGGIAGQALVFSSFVMIPLHVIDKKSPRSVCLVDRRGCRSVVHLAGVLAIDGAWDSILYRTVGPEVPNTRRAIVRVDAAGAAVDISAITNGKSALIDHMAVLESRVREVVRIARHHFQSASGREIVARDVCAILLNDPVAPGWSGAAVSLRDSADVLGFVHGNASANDGAAVCLVPREDSPVLNVLRNQHGARR